MERLYHDTCDIYKGVEALDDISKQTYFSWELIRSGEPCRVSFSGVVPVVRGDAVTTVSQTIKLFLKPGVEVLPGSKIIVTRGGVETEYRASGQPASYPSHQEVMLELAVDYS